MSKTILRVPVVMTCMLVLVPTWAMAQNAWSNYRSVQTKPDRVTPLRQPFENGLSQYDHPPEYRNDKRWRGGNYPNQHPYARDNGVTIVYRQGLPYQQDYRYERQVFINGQPLPEQYRHAQYRVDDWSRFQLDQPLYGRHWVRVDGTYLLIQDDNFVIELVR